MSGRLGEAADSATAIVNASPATAAAVNPSSHPLMRRTWRDQVGRARTGGVSDLAEDFAGGGCGMLLRRAGGGVCGGGGCGMLLRGAGGHELKKTPAGACRGRPQPARSAAAERRRREGRHTGRALLQVQKNFVCFLQRSADRATEKVFTIEPSC